MRAKSGQSPDGAARFLDAAVEAAGREEWIIDGHYRDIRHHVWKRSDLVIYLNFPLLVIVTRIGRRFLRKRRDRLLSRGNGPSPGGAEISQANKPVSASWSKRLERMIKTLSERKEYAQILVSGDYAGLDVLELRSPHEARRFLEHIR